MFNFRPIVVALGLCIVSGGFVASARAQSPAPEPANPTARAAAPSPALQLTDAENKNPVPQDRGWFAISMVAAVFGSTAFSLLTIRRSLLASAWSLSDALSEDVDLTPAAPAAAPPAGAAPAPGAAASQPTVRKLVASTSRFIAMLGLVAILMMFIGFGLVILYDFALTGTPPTKDSLLPLIYFLTSGLTLFAPYAVNKVASAMS